MTNGRRNKPRVVRFNTGDDVAAEVDRLRANGYRRHGNWTLPQICRHLAVSSEGALKPPATFNATPEQAAMKKALVDVILTTGEPPADLEAPDFLTPPADCNDGDIDRLKAMLVALAAYPHSHVDFGPMGPVPIGELRAMTLLHAAHHLAFLEPNQPGIFICGRGGRTCRCPGRLAGGALNRCGNKSRIGA